jgi:hypothetical protein
MDLHVGEIVRSLNGHDEGRLYYVLRTEGEFFYLVDGKHRKVEAPKKKRRKHVSLEGIWTHPVTDRMQSGEPVLDSEIRRALAAFRDKFSGNQGGMTLGEKRHD